jgi:hypothetical protein
MPRVICVVDTNHDQLLPHFLPHYRRLGVTGFVFGVRRGRLNPAWAYLAALNAPDIELLETHPPSSAINGIVDSVFINNVKTKNADWYIPADLDEFHVPGDLSFPAAQKLCLAQSANFVASRLVDRVTAAGGIPPGIAAAPSIYAQFPRTADIAGAIMGGATAKVCLAHPAVNVLPGHHQPKHATPQPADIAATTLHFKWFGDVLQRERQKYATRSAAGSAWQREQVALFAYLSGTGNKFLDPSS